MRIATWNVNSVRARLPRLVPWLEEHAPDLVCLQETKVVDEQFPREYLEDQGYDVEVFGQKTYNGVALLSRHRMEAVVRGFPDDADDAQRRVIGCQLGDWQILNLYVPNGAEVGSDKYAFKLDWLRRLRRFLDDRYDPAGKLVVTGDFNITFDDRDVYDPELWRERILCSTPERDALAAVMDFGLVDALRHLDDSPGIYTWWDMRGGAFPKDQGLRIDHVLVTRPALDALRAVTVDRDARAGKSPSDHAPVVASFDA
ncbi:MAG: exodeoxyribonuclease III [Planctomycetes bacterium]|nr:exodeoxyribonuclease III [Planctomycetota bacterium]